MTYRTRAERVDREVTRAELSEVRRRYGRADIVASLLGMLTALGTLMLLTVVLAAMAVELQIDLINEQGALDELEMVGSIVAIVVVFVSFLIGGIAAGRIARYDGVMNAIGSALWFLLLVAIAAALGAWVGDQYNFFAEAGLPNWIAQVDVEDVTVAAIVMAVISVVAMFLAAWIGGWIGESYHRRVDAAVVDEAVH